MPYTDWTALAHTTQDYIPVANVVGATINANLTVNVKDSPYGAIGDGVTDDTAAFNAAIATGNCVFIPDGTYKLTSLTNYTGSSFHLKGNGRKTKLVFNTTGSGITVTLAGGSAQSRTLHIEGLSFGNSVNTPASFIKIGYAVNPVIENCYFSDTSATYCIENVSGYGVQVKNCVFSDITGGGYVHRFDAGSAASFVRCDFTRLSGTGIRFENTTAAPASTAVFDTVVVETCGGAGIEFNKGVGGGYAWNVLLIGCHLEGNTGFDLDINPNGSATPSYACITSCTFNGTPTIDIGNSSKLQINSCTNSGGNVCVISGSSNAQVHLFNSLNFSQSGTFIWSDNTGASIAYTPTIGGMSTSSLSAVYSVHGRMVTVQVSAVSSGVVTAAITVSLPIAASGNVANVTVGTASATKSGVGYYIGAAWYNTSNSVVKIHSLTGGNEWSASLPFVWAANDSFDMTFTYFI